MAQCPDCKLNMTSHTLTYIHKKRGYCKGVPAETEPIKEESSNSKENKLYQPFFFVLEKRKLY